ncbi:MAG: hypothetical protein LUH40_01375 [Clostridiales bacterium]|nr:hypothetical protein [Clostridiales bacterium]
MSGSNYPKKEEFMQNIKTAGLIFADIVLINAASLLALFVRFEFDITELLNSNFLHHLFVFSPYNTIVTIIVFMLFKLYRGIWKFAGVDEFIAIAEGCITSAAITTISIIICRNIFDNFSLPRSFPLLYLVFLVIFITIVRFSYRFAGRLKRMEIGGGKNLKRIMIIGAGRSGATVLREFQTSSHSEGKVLCMLDRDPKKSANTYTALRLSATVKIYRRLPKNTESIK